MTTTKEDPPLIGVVGPCSAGKSTLIAELQEYGVRTRHIAQEHSYVKDMWRRLSNPDILIYLDVSYPVAQERRKLTWTEGEYQKQIHRLRHAREHADFYLSTDDLTPNEVLKKVLELLKELDNV